MNDKKHPSAVKIIHKISLVRLTMIKTLLQVTETITIYLIFSMILLDDMVYLKYQFNKKSTSSYLDVFLNFCCKTQT